jgi:hypothetical protein
VPMIQARGGHRSADVGRTISTSSCRNRAPALAARRAVSARRHRGHPDPRVPVAQPVLVPVAFGILISYAPIPVDDPGALAGAARPGSHADTTLALPHELVWLGLPTTGERAEKLPRRRMLRESATCRKPAGAVEAPGGGCRWRRRRRRPRAGQHEESPCVGGTAPLTELAAGPLARSNRRPGDGGVLPGAYLLASGDRSSASS